MRGEERMKFAQRTRGGKRAMCRRREGVTHRQRGRHNRGRGAGGGGRGVKREGMRKMSELVICQQLRVSVCVWCDRETDMERSRGAHELVRQRQDQRVVCGERERVGS